MHVLISTCKPCETPSFLIELLHSSPAVFSSFIPSFQFLIRLFPPSLSPLLPPSSPPPSPSSPLPPPSLSPLLPPSLSSLLLPSFPPLKGLNCSSRTVIQMQCTHTYRDHRDILSVTVLGMGLHIHRCAWNRDVLLEAVFSREPCVDSSQSCEEGSEVECTFVVVEWILQGRPIPCDELCSHTHHEHTYRHTHTHT